MAYYLPSLVLLGVLVIGIPHVLGITGDGRQTIEVKAGEDVFLSCEYDTIRRYIWERNNRSVGDLSITRDNRLYVVRGRGLVILNAEQTDGGIFVCTVIFRNGGFSEKVYKLSVVARDEPAEDIQCGYVNQRSRILGGRDVNAPGLFPWMVLLWHKTYNAPICGGALLSRRFVVTTATCFMAPGYGSDEVQVKLGKYNISRTEPYERTIDIAQIISHAEYSPVTLDSDILLLRLAEPVAYSDYIVPICLPSEIRGEALLATGTRGTVAGWGQSDTETLTYSNILKKAKLTIRDFQTCGNQHTYILTNNMFCALGGNREGNIRDTCHGDSGGPFIVEENDRSYLVGIVSWGIGCGDINLPGVYTRVNRFRSWILDNINTDFQSGEETSFQTREDLDQELSKIQALEEQVELLTSQLKDQDTFVCTTPSPPVTTLSPYQDISIPCRQGACLHVGGFHVRGQCINGICECNSPHYNNVTCLPTVGSCDIRENDPSNNHAVPFDSCGSIPSPVYSCVGELGRTSDVHILGVYEGNVHTRPPTAGTMNVHISHSANTRTVVLVFASYEPVEWVLDFPESLRIEKVILISYYIQHSSVRLADGITRAALAVEKKTRNTPRGYGKDSGGGNTAGMILGLSRIYGSVTSFAGTYRADAWSWTLPVGTDSSSTLEETVGDSGSLPGSPVTVNENTWTEYSYRSENNWNSCHGTKYVRKRPNTDGQIGQFVGATLCDSNSRYKLFMSDDLNGVFQNIADASGHGQDHCEFVGAPSDGEFNLDSSFSHSPSADGYYRSNWGDNMQYGQIGGGMVPSQTGRYYPKWYECGVTIP